MNSYTMYKERMAVFLDCKNSEVHTENSFSLKQKLEEQWHSRVFWSETNLKREVLGIMQTFQNEKLKMNLNKTFWLTAGFLDSSSFASYARLLVNGSLKALRSKWWARNRHIMSRIGLWTAVSFSFVSFASSAACGHWGCAECLSIAVGQTNSRRCLSTLYPWERRRGFISFPMFAVCSSIRLISKCFFLLLP